MGVYIVSSYGVRSTHSIDLVLCENIHYLFNCYRTSPPDPSLLDNNARFCPVDTKIAPWCRCRTVALETSLSSAYPLGIDTRLYWPHFPLRENYRIFFVFRLLYMWIMVVDTLDRPLPARPRYQCCALAAVISWCPTSLASFFFSLLTITKIQTRPGWDRDHFSIFDEPWAFCPIDQCLGSLRHPTRDCLLTVLVLAGR